MPVTRVDAVVVGAGVFGLASALELADRGYAVAVLDRFGTGHAATSSTGASRSIRVAYSDPVYVDLARRALGRWSDLERQSGRTILHLTGQVDLGPEAVLDSLVESTAAAGVTIQRRTAKQLAEDFPELSDGRDGLFQTDAGTVMAAEGLEAMREAALEAGVTIFMPERVMSVEPDQPARVVADARTVVADHVVMAAGPWTGALLAEVGISLPLAPSVAQVTFLDAPTMTARPGIAAWPDAGGVGVYGHPVPGIGYKLAFDAGTAGWDGEVELWGPDSLEEERLLSWMTRHLGGAPLSVAYSQRHPWTMTPDSDFVVDRRGPIVLACGCSGHAFKFGPALGPVVADVVDGLPAVPLFSLDRPRLAGQASPTTAIGR